MSVNDDDQLSALRAQRRKELQEQIENQVNLQTEAELENHKKQLESQALTNSMKRLLSGEARERIARISLATPQRAESIKKMIVSMFENKEFNPPMSDQSLKSLLVKQSKSRNSGTIRRI